MGCIVAARCLQHTVVFLHNGMQTLRLVATLCIVVVSLLVRLSAQEGCATQLEQEGITANSTDTRCSTTPVYAGLAVTMASPPTSATASLTINTTASTQAPLPSAAPTEPIEPIVTFQTSASQVYSSSTQDTSEFIPWEQFQYAGVRQYIMDGSQPRRTTKLRPTPAIIAGSASAAIVAGLQIYQGIVYWADRATFRIIDDGDLELYADKVGHFMAGYIASKIAKDMMLTAGYGWDMAVLCGSLMGLGYQFYVEVMDGFGRNWGFSPSDMWFNMLGAGLHFAQHHVPFLQNIQPKGQFYPPQWFGQLPRPNSGSLFDDYSSWTMWLSLNVHNLLPAEMQRWYPSWLNLAVGYAVRNVDRPDADRKIILALDYDLEKILPTDDNAPFWNWFRQYLNMLKLPSPAIEFSFTRPPRFYLLYPFPLGATP
jgi:hypothetical protein